MTRTLTIATLLLLLGAATIAIQLRALAVHIAALEPIPVYPCPVGDSMQTLVLRWRSARGEEVVETPSKEGETQAAHLARHNAMVSIAQAANPPVN